MDFLQEIFLTVFYLLGYGNWVLVLFGFIDLGFGLWTWVALRIDKKSSKKYFWNVVKK